MRSRFALSTAVCLAAILPGGGLLAQTPNQATRVARAVDPQVLRAHLGFLADDALEGRRPGTRGGELAAKYIAAQFERLGLQPAGDSGTYFHQVPIITLSPNPTSGLLARRRESWPTARTTCSGRCETSRAFK